MGEEKADSEKRRVDLSFEDLAGFVEQGDANPKDLPARLEMKKWLFETRLEYARNFFDHHAKQRMSMFNFFLIFVAFAVGGYASLLKDQHYQVASWLAFFGAVLTVCFICLDRRNEELVHVSEDVLESLESDTLFVDYDRPILWPRRRNWWGTLKNDGEVKNGETERIKRPLGIFRRQTADQYGWVRNKDGVREDLKGPHSKCGKSPYEHGRWLRGTQVCILVMFLFLAAHGPEAWHKLYTLILNYRCPCS